MIAHSIVFSIAAAIAAPPSDAELDRALPRIPPKSVGDALAGFRVAKGFHIERVAAEPLTADPVAMVQDERGRAYVVEMRGYPFPEETPTGEVRLLEDRNGDGEYDSSTVFLDRLNWPTSIVMHDGGVFIAAAPDIIYAKDADGDGKAEIRKVVFTGFGVQNVQALVNGLLWGPDGWIYGVSGGNGGVIRNPERADLPPLELGQRDFRFKPDGSTIEPVPGGGQFGHSFDDYGHRFICNNSNHIRQIVMPPGALERNPAYAGSSAIADIAAEGPAAEVYRISPPEPWRVVRTRERAADPAMVARLPATELAPVGFFTSATGVTIYRGSAYPPELRGNAFIGDVGGNLVHRKRLERSGAVFKAVRADAGKEFLASPDNWFRPVNFSNAADGTLWVLDMSRETIEHPLSIPEHIKKRLDLTSGRDRGRIYRIAPDGFKPRPMEDLGALKSETLVAMLGDRDGWWRDTAARLLRERKDPAAIGPLRTTIRKSFSPQARLGAAEVLASLGKAEVEDIELLLHDADPGVREAGVELLRRFDTARRHQSALVKLTTDPDAMVRFRTAIALGDYPSIFATSKLKELLSRDHADPWIRAAVYSGLEGRAGELLLLLSNAPVKLPEEGDEWIEPVAELAGYEAAGDSINNLIETFIPEDLLKRRYEADLILSGLARGARRAGKSLRDALNDEAKREIDPLIAAASKAIFVAEIDTPNRKRALSLLALAPDAVVLDTAPRLLDAKTPVELQLAAIEMLSGLRKADAAEAILERLRSLSPAVYREAIEYLFARGERIKRVLDAAEAGTFSLSELDPARIAFLRGLKSPELKARAAKLLSGLTRSDRSKLIATYAPALARMGDARKGREVYRKVCASCHQAGDEGKAVGPPLKTVAAKSPDDLLTAILDPNRETAPIYANYAVLTVDGRVITGIIASESGQSLSLKRAEGIVESIARDRVEEIKSTGASLMPEGFEKEISPAAMADLIAYLKSLGIAQP